MSNHRRRGASFRTLLVGFPLFLLAASLRLPDLDAWVNIDAFLWYERAVKFWNTPQVMHMWGPHGVMFLWLAGGSMKLLGVLDDGMIPTTVRAATLPIAVVGSLMPGLSFLLLARLLGRKGRGVAFLTGALLATEPFLVGHSRSMHIDMLATSFGWLGALSVAVAARRRSFAWSGLGGTFLGAAVLSKVIGSVLAAGVGLWLLLLFVVRRDWRTLALLFVASGTALIVVALLCPGLVDRPIATFTWQLAGSRALVNLGHEVFFLDTISMDPGLGFYPVVALLRTTPEVLLAAAVGLAVVLRHAGKWRRDIGGLLLSYLPAALITCLSPKKGDRYYLLFLPLVCTVASVGASWLWQQACGWLTGGRGVRLSVRATAAALGVAGLLLVGARTLRVLRVHPHVTAWCSKIPLLPAEKVFLLGWGEGMTEVAKWIRAAAPGRAPQVFGGTYGPCMSPWLRFTPVEPNAAEFIVRYLSDDQRDRYRQATDPFVRDKTPLYEAWLDGRRYASVFAGPHHRDYAAP